MKKLILPVLCMSLLLGATNLSAQYQPFCAEMNYSIEIVDDSNGEVTFDIFWTSNKPTDDACGFIYPFFTGTFVDFDESMFSNPDFVKVSQFNAIGQETGFCTFTPETPGFEVNGVFLNESGVQSFHFGATSVSAPDGIISNDGDTFISISLDNPTISPGNYMVSAAQIDNSGDDNRLGRFTITGYVGTPGSGDHMVVPVNGVSPSAFTGGGETNAEVFESQVFTLDPTNGDSRAVTVIADDALPVRLTKFEANRYNRTSSIVRWETASEDNTSHFLVQRKAKGDDTWQYVGKVDAEGFSTDLNQYTFIDNDVFDGKTNRAEFFYRLQIVDFDGRAEFSSVDAVNFALTIAEGEIKTFPNPAVDGVHVQISNELPSPPTEIMVFDVVGKVVHSQVVGEGDEYAYIDLRASNISAGTYVVQFMAGQALLTQQKLIVQSK